MNLESLCHKCGADLGAASTERHPLCATCAAAGASARLSRRCYRNRLRAYRVGAPGWLRPKDVRRLWSRQSGRCAYCRRSLGTLSARPPAYHIEHRVPLDRGGENTAVNACLSCPPCNAAKGTLTEEEFRCQ